MFENFQSDLMTTIQDYYESLVHALPKIATAFIIFILFLFIAVKISQMTRKKLVQKMEDPLLAKFIARIARWIVVIVGFMLALNAVGLGSIAGGLLAGAGVSAFIIGFAFKDIGENFLAGILLAFSRPFKVGHTIESNNVMGNVVSLDLRNTQIKTFDGKDIFIPNSYLIKNPLINYTIDGFLRQEFEIGIDYGSDYDKAMAVVLKTINQIPGVLKEGKAPTVIISKLGDSALVIKVYYWLDTFDKSVSGLKIKTEAINKCLVALTQSGNYLPGNVLELKNYSGQQLIVAQKIEATADAT